MFVNSALHPVLCIQLLTKLGDNDSLAGARWLSEALGSAAQMVSASPRPVRTRAMLPGCLREASLEKKYCAKYSFSANVRTMSWPSPRGGGASSGAETGDLSLWSGSDVRSRRHLFVGVSVGVVVYHLGAAVAGEDRGAALI